MRTKFHLPFGQHIYSDAPRAFVVDQIITLYSNKGLKGFTNTRWPGDAFQPTAHIINDVGYQLGRWCLEQKAYDLLKAFHSVFSANAHKELIAHTLHSKDDTGFDFLLNLRPNVSWMDAMSLAFGPQSSQEWLNKVMAHTVGNAVWQECGEKLIYECGVYNSTEAAEALLGHWCGVCQSLLCTAPEHAHRPFLNARTHGKHLAGALRSFTSEMAYINDRVHENCAHVLNAVRVHPAWDNELEVVQTPLEKILKKAVKHENVDLIALLLGPNDRLLNASERKQQLCVNKKHITSAFLTLTVAQRSKFGQHFIGLMDESFFEGKSQWYDTLEANRRQRLNLELQQATVNNGDVRVKRKM